MATKSALWSCKAGRIRRRAARAELKSRCRASQSRRCCCSVSSRLTRLLAFVMQLIPDFPAYQRI